MKITEFYKPMDTRDAYEKLVGQKKAMLIAGGVYMRLQNRTIPLVIDLEPLNLKGIKSKDTSLTIGAMTTLSDIENSQALPKLLTDSVRQIAGVSVRNLATIGGSIMGRYPFSDINTALLALQAVLHFHVAGAVTLEAFLNGTDREPDILLEIELPLKVHCTGAFKAFKQVYTDFSLVNVAICQRTESTTISIGARPGRAMCVTLTPGSPIVVDDLLAQFTFGEDYRATSNYRKALAQVLLEDCLEETIQEVPTWK